MVFCKMANDWYKHGESLILVGLQDVKEIVVLEKAHCSISNLQMDTSNASDDSLEKFWNEMLNFVYFTDFKYFLKLSQEKGFLDAICKWPILKESVQKWDGKCSIFSQEEHRASKELLVECGNCLNLVKWNDNVLEEDNMLISEWDSETTDDTCKDIEKLGSTIEFVSLMNKGKEALVH